jgi:nucleotide-binding universal stress UspA family protein
MRRILVPTDFSENSWNAIKYGVELLQDKCSIYLLHINAIPIYSGAGSSITASSSLLKESLALENKRCMEKLMERIKTLPSHKRHTFIPLILTDYFVDAIKREVQDKNINLILMGTKGASGLRQIAMGTNTGAVITKVKCPLLAIPQNASYRKLREVAFPTDFQIVYDIRVLEDLIKILTATGASLRILYMSKNSEGLSEEQQRNKDFLDDYLKEIEHSFHILKGGRLETSVQCFIDSRDIDMVAMVAKNLNFIQRILFRPAVEEISYHTTIPFLVLHE